FTPQGAQLVPYEWFLALEQPGSTNLFRDNQNILKYRYLPQKPGPGNPDGLPVGFVGSKGDGPHWPGLTCAACHTNEIRDETSKVGYRVDGAPAHADVQALLTDLTAALQDTLRDEEKFGRFATKVVGGLGDKGKVADLKAELERLVTI